MKQGKNKPLDEEEVEFLDEVELQKREDEKKRLEREKDDIECFKLLRETMVVKAAPPRTVVRGGAGARAGVATGGGASLGKRGAGDDAAGGAGAGAKKPKPSMMSTPKFVPKFKAVPKKAPPEDVEGEKKDDNEGGGLGGLLGYGSGSEDD